MDVEQGHPRMASEVANGRQFAFGEAIIDENGFPLYSIHHHRQIF